MIKSRKYLAAALTALWSSFSYADTSAISTGDTAWLLTSTVLVLLMTPGLAFFYGGMVRTKNVVTTLFQSMITIAIVGFFWCVAGYTLAFSANEHSFIGDLRHLFLNGVNFDPIPGQSIPHSLFMLFQCMFAVITPALITGAFAERAKFKFWIVFAFLWSLCVYVPVAHWVWTSNGWIAKIGGLDFAGGLVVHMTAGYSALCAAMLFGKRRDFGKEMRQHDTGMILLGTTLLYFGWFGFNAGSALAASGLAAHAAATTFFASIAAMVGWMGMDWMKNGRPNLTGACIGLVVGLVAITPACGYVGFGAALFIGLFSGGICNLLAAFLKNGLGLDDSLDVFACHGAGGTIGVLLTGLFASKNINPAGANGLFYGGFDLLKANLLGALAVALYAFAVTFVLFKVVGALLRVRAADKEEDLGLDYTEHGEFINDQFPLNGPESVKNSGRDNSNKRPML